jgi:hypothetical protein
MVKNFVINEKQKDVNSLFIGIYRGEQVLCFLIFANGTGK